MLETMVDIAFVLLVALATYIWFLRKGRPSAAMPSELAEAKLWAAEKEIFCTSPVPLHGKPDQVFLLLNGQLVVVDVKSHARAYPSDIMQMSVYRVILLSAGHRVADYGYIRAITPGGEKFIKRNLFETRVVITAWTRHHGLIDGLISPSLTKIQALCKTCGHRGRC